MGCDESSDHGDFGSPFQLKFSSHAADILGADGDGGVEGGCGQGGGGGVGGRWWGGGVGWRWVEHSWASWGHVVVLVFFDSEKMFWIVSCLLDVSFFTF